MSDFLGCPLFRALLELTFFGRPITLPYLAVGYKMMSGNIMMSADGIKKLETNERIDPTDSS
jgi:hypothetical protein